MAKNGADFDVVSNMSVAANLNISSNNDDCGDGAGIDETSMQKEFIHQIAELNRGTVKKYFIGTFGCQMNENDSERLAGMLTAMGYLEASDIRQAHIIIYNTCCVRENAENKLYGHIGALKELKKQNPDIVIAVCGCMMQQEDAVKHITKSYRHVDLIFGTHNLHRFPELLYRVLKERRVIVDVVDDEYPVIEGIPVKRENNIKAWVTIMHGCNNFCSYCIVPYVRGREKSRKIEDIVKEVTELASQGYKEITLLGQNVNSYGKDMGNGTRFEDLLYRINDIPGIERIRFMTSHPKDLSDGLIQAIRNCSKVCEHLQLPVQSGSSKVLKDMNRKYTKEQYLELVSKVKENIPGIALTTDIIVGFPGETDDDFEDTLDVVEKAQFDMAYMFLYSKRKGTPAAEREDQVPDEIKKIRFDRLLNVQNRISKSKNDLLVGTNMEVLVEGLSKTDPGFYTGRTRTNKIVNFKADRDLTGSMATVRINNAFTWYLEGEVVK